MPDLITNTQGQNSTVSDNGRNVRPVLQAVSHFVLQTDNGVCNISQTNSFGVVSVSEFRTTSKLTFTGAKKVYMLCKGQVLLQPTSDSNKVNLILKPFEQPIKGLPIKYIIYRGLTKSDFINSSDILTGSATNGTEFVQFLWKEFNQFYSSENHPPGTTPPVFSSSFIGFPTGTSQPDSQLIDTLFYKLSETEVVDAGAGTLSEPAEKAFELPMIPRGTVLGTVSADLGIDIVLNQGDYYIENDAHPFQFNLGYARSLDYKLNTINEPDEFKKKLIRETCTQFMDVSAFYGLHANGSGKVYVNGTTTPLTTIDAVYGLMGGFYTKNTQYFYIQSSRQRSYNFYGNYTYSDTNANNLKIGTDSSNLTEVVFGDTSWPIHKVSTNPTTYFQLITDNYKEAALFCELGMIATSHENNFIRNANLLQEVPENTSVIVDFNFTKPIGFRFDTSGTDVVASMVKLIYEGKQLLVSEYVAPPTDPNAPEVVPNSFVLKDIDDVFGLLDTVPFVATKNEKEYPSVVDEQLQLVHFPNSLGKIDTGVVKVKRIADAIKIDDTSDLERITFETLLMDCDFNGSTFVKNNTPLKEGNVVKTMAYSKEQNNFYQPEKPFSFSTVLFTDSETTITGVVLEQDQGKLPAKKILGISKDEYQRLVDLANENNLLNAKLFFRNLLENQEDYFLSAENVKYKSYTLDIIAENELGEYLLFCLNEDVRIYSVDDRGYYSTKYSESIPFNKNNNISLDLI